MYSCSMAAMTVYERLNGLNDRNVFFHSFGGWKAKIKVLAEIVSGETSFLALLMATFLLYPQRVFLLCPCTPGVSDFSCKDTSPYKGSKALK